MKAKMVFGSALVFFLLFLSIMSLMAQPAVDIPDPELRTAIESALGKPAGDAITTADMTLLTALEPSRGSISNLKGLESATNLSYLVLGSNAITDISALSKLTNLRTLSLRINAITDISALSKLTNLTYLEICCNTITDISALSKLTNLSYLGLGSNAITNISALSKLTNLTHLRLWGNTIADISPLVENSGLDRGDSVDVRDNPLSEASINTHIPKLKNRGVRIRYHTTQIRARLRRSGAFVNVGDTFSIRLTADSVTNIAGWQLSVFNFSPEGFSAVSVHEGDLLKQDSGSTFFQEGSIDNSRGLIRDVSAVRLGGSVSGAGELLSITFEAKSTGKSIGIARLLLLQADGAEIPYEIERGRVSVTNRSGDLNGDGEVNILDLILVAQRQPGADINGDGMIDIFDLILVAQNIGGMAAPGANPTDQTIQHWIDMARAADDGSPAFRRGIANLKRLFLTAIPDTTALLHNYPNPFNPETWIPYRLAEDANVTLSIYDVHGALVRRLELGRQSAGYYTERGKAAYWDGHNENGEPAVSGVYFYQLATPSFRQLRRMTIVK